MAQQNQQFQNALAAQAQEVKNLTELVNQMKGIREASGVDAIMGPGIVNNFKTQSDIVSKEQNDLD